MSRELLAQPPSAAPKNNELFRRDNLIAWCIVPFDAKNRTPEERAAMLEQLGFKHFAYDYRKEHVPTFDDEIAACRKHGVSFDAWWFPSTLNDEARLILEVCRRNNIRPALWVSGGGAPTKNADEQRQRIEQEAARIRPIAEAAATQGMKVGLYNHGGWFGDPENQLAVLDSLKLPNVGIVYNLHHGHDHLDRFASVLPKLLPHLLALNLNGMNPDGERRGQKILQLGQGELDLALLRTIRDSGYRGPIGILGHTQDDAEARLQDNLDGLDWLVAQLDGQPALPRPKPRTPVPQSKGTLSSTGQPVVAGYLAAGRAEYRTPPLTVDVRATLRSKQRYNILVASDTKASATHWELFTMPGTGHLCAYLPGMKPDHARSQADICDARPHEIRMLYEATRVRLFVDGREVASQAIESNGGDTVAGGLGIGRLVEGGIGCDGQIESVRLSRGVDPTAKSDALAFWLADAANGSQMSDQSLFKNHARSAPASGRDAPQALPSAGVHLKPVDARMRVALIDRSPNEAYMGVKVDQEGQLFVGGREGVFLFEQQADGSYGPRRELLRFPADSIIMGLEFRGNDLYVVTAGAVYLVPNGRVQREGLVPQRILWGMGLNLHNSMHCLAWGPDGDLYLSHGDPLLTISDWSRPDHWNHWTLYCGVDEKPIPFTGQGAILKMKPDGTDVRVVATGLRGPVGLAFDADGNLFTNDNDHESQADRYAPSRLLHVVPGIDFGWPRGWMASKSPDRYDLIEPVCDLGRGVPCDLMYYTSRYLPDSVRDRLLMCRWDRYSVTGYRLQPRGISFSAAEETILQGEENCRPTGIAADRQGRLFVTALYMGGNMASPYCASDLMLVSLADGVQPGPTTAPVSHGNWLKAFQSGMKSAEQNAYSDDTYRRQLGIAMLAQNLTISELARSANSQDEPKRLVATLVAGRRLTVPAADYVPPPELPLLYPNEGAFTKRNLWFWNTKEPLDLTTTGRMGSFNIASRWSKVAHSNDEKLLYELLIVALDDSSDRVRLQAAYYLSLLKDPRSEPLVERTRREVKLRRLLAASERRVEQAWGIGPFDDGDNAAMSKPHGPEQGLLDLSATYGSRSWNEHATSELQSLGGSAMQRQTSIYAHFRVASRSRQPALLTIAALGKTRLWCNGTPVAEAVPVDDPEARAWFVDLQPGSNDVLLRLQRGADLTTVSKPRIKLQAVDPVEIVLPEKLDSSLLAQRLRESSSAGGSQPVPAEFLALDWTAESKRGNAAAGRKLFGTLGCVKCHAIVPDQQSLGAPSLFEAKRRFAVAHIVESVLLPSRQVAEPFRAQSFVLDDGRTLMGLVVAESTDTVDVILPDATRARVIKKQVEQRETLKLSPMPQGLVKTPVELRDILAYLLSDRPLPP